MSTVTILDTCLCREAEEAMGMPGYQSILDRAAMQRVRRPLLRLLYNQSSAHKR